MKQIKHKMEEKMNKKVVSILIVIILILSSSLQVMATSRSELNDRTSVLNDNICTR